jgi:tetratricopeptide (TPR) repeat protein
MTSSVSLLLRCLCVGALACAQWARADELSEVQRLHATGQTSAALQRAEQFLAAKAKDPQMRFLKGVLLAESQRPAEALDIFSRLSEDYPELAEPYNNIAALHAAAGDYDKAKIALEQAVRVNPGYATAHENLGDVHAMLAGRAYARASQLDPGSATAPAKLAIVRQLLTPKAGADASTASPRP